MFKTHLLIVFSLLAICSTSIAAEKYHPIVCQVTAVPTVTDPAQYSQEVMDANNIGYKYFFKPFTVQEGQDEGVFAVTGGTGKVHPFIVVNLLSGRTYNSFFASLSYTAAPDVNPSINFSPDGFVGVEFEGDEDNDMLAKEVPHIRSIRFSVHCGRDAKMIQSMVEFHYPEYVRKEYPYVTTFGEWHSHHNCGSACQ